MKITEENIITDYLKPLTFNNINSLNLSDDIYYDNKNKIVISTDTYEEGIHFIKSSWPKFFVKKIFRASISDIICKGSKPKVYFLSLSINKINHKWLNSFKDELSKESKKFGLYLGGGDTIRSKKLSVTITVIGEALKKPILRKTSHINDDLYITGNIGDSYIGLNVLLKKFNLGKFNNYFKKSFVEPVIQQKFSEHLHKFASASMDLSDGLILDLSRLCKASKCGAILSFIDLPFSKNLRNISKKKKINLKNVFSRGDDYQILFTSNPKNRNLIKSISKKTNTKISRVGKIIPQKIIKMDDGDKMNNFSTNKTGYIHSF